MNDSRPGCLVCVTGLLAMVWAALVMFVGSMALAPETTNTQYALIVAQPVALFLSAMAGFGRVRLSLVFAAVALCCIGGFLISARGERGSLEMLWIYSDLAIPSCLHAIVCVAALAWQRFLMARMPPPADRSLPSIHELARRDRS